MGINAFKLSRWWFLLKRGKSIKDTAVLGAVGGFLGTVAMVLSNTLIFKAGITEIRYGHIAGSIFMSPIRTRQRKNFILGQIFHFITGSGAGLVMVQIFKKFGTDLALLKGSMLGMFTWEVLYNVGQRLGIYTAKPHLTKTGYSALWNNFLYGTVTAYSVKWLAHPSVILASEHIDTQDGMDSDSDKLYQVPKFENAEEQIQVHKSV